MTSFLPSRAASRAARIRAIPQRTNSVIVHPFRRAARLRASYASAVSFKFRRRVSGLRSASGAGTALSDEVPLVLVLFMVDIFFTLWTFATLWAVLQCGGSRLDSLCLRTTLCTYHRCQNTHPQYRKWNAGCNDATKPKVPTVPN